MGRDAEIACSPHCFSYQINIFQIIFKGKTESDLLVRSTMTPIQINDTK